MKERPSIRTQIITVSLSVAESDDLDYLLDRLVGTRHLMRSQLIGQIITERAQHERTRQQQEAKHEQETEGRDQPERRGRGAVRAGIQRSPGRSRAG